MTKTEIHTVPDNVAKSRLSDYLIGIYPLLSSKSSVKKAIAKKQIKLDRKIGQTADFISGGEQIEFLIKVKTAKVLELELEVLYEDEYLAVINKPAGIEVSGNKHRTVQHALAYNLKPGILPGSLPEPEPIHRLDYPTSGALLIGKTQQVVLELNRMFENKTITKVYNAITIGKVKTEGQISNPVDDKDANTYFKVICAVSSPRFKYLNFMSLHPTTGRKHQLRKHMAELGNPILGDKQYGHADLILKGKGLYLHARSLEFKHPVSNKKIFIEAELPQKFNKIFPSI